MTYASLPHLNPLPQGEEVNVKSTKTLSDHLTAHLTTPFAWGTHDCVGFAAAWVKASTGVDHLADMKQKRDKREGNAPAALKREVATLLPSPFPLTHSRLWTTAAQAARAIRQAGGLEAALDARFQRIEPHYAQDGDLALHNGCVCIFSGVKIVGPGKTGLTHNSRVLADAAWSVGAHVPARGTPEDSPPLCGDPSAGNTPDSIRDTP